MAERQSVIPSHVLVVEDNPILSTQLEMMLEDLGVAKVISLATVADALRALDDNEFDMAILDIQLGRENGLTVADRCAQKHVPVILATGFGDVLFPVTYSNEQLLQKPYSMKDLERAIERIMSRSIAVRSIPVRGSE